MLWHYIPLFIMGLFFPISQQAQNEIIPPEKELFQTEIDVAGIKNWLKNAPHEKDKSAKSRIIIISLPMPDGELLDFQAIESPILFGKTSQRLKDFKTYTIQAIDKELVSGKLSITSRGIDALILSPEGNIFIEPIKGAKDQHRVYYEKDGSKFLHQSEDLLFTNEKGYEHRHSPEEERHQHLSPIPKAGALMIGADLRQFRIKVVAKKEYAEQHSNIGDSEADRIMDVEAAILATINGMNAIYERDIAIRLMMVDPIVFLEDPENDFGSPVMLFGQSSSLAREALAAFDDLTQDDPNISWDGVSPSSFDLGHVFGGVGGNGSAFIGVACRDENFNIDLDGDGSIDGAFGPAKGGAGTQSSNASGSGWFQLVSHEVGHQFSALHTFNGSDGNCGNPGQYSPSAAYEVGSGVTIMSYRGTCSNDNIITRNGNSVSTSYFHINSIETINNYITAGLGTCAALINNNNNPPVIDADPCSSGTILIPVNTPFELTAAASDLDPGDMISYAWEQYDLGLQGPANTGPNDALGDDGPGGMENGAPIFRSYPPTDSPTRIFPDDSILSDPISGPNDCNSLIISEVAEDDGDDQCIEIYNPTSNAINLGSSVIWLAFFANGSGGNTGSVFLSGTIQPYETFTICNPSANIPGFTPDQTHLGISFDGNDAIALIDGGMGNSFIDIFGVIGVDPGAGGWSGFSDSQPGINYIRKINVTQARSSNSSFNVFTEWNVFSSTSDDLGTHTNICGNFILGEALPQTAREMTFRSTVRDGNGGVDYDERTVSVSSDGPFTVETPLATWNSGSMQTVSWNNGGFTACSNVNILMSGDGGQTFPYIIDSAVPFLPGSWTGDIPSNLPNTSEAVLKVACADNPCATFFNISGVFEYSSSCFAATSSFSPEETVIAPPGDPSLNLGLSNLFSQIINSFSFDLSSGGVGTMDFIRDDDNDGMDDCEEVPVSPVNYDATNFAVSQTGTYTFTKSSGFKVMSIFTATGFDTSNPCNNYEGTNAFDAKVMGSPTSTTTFNSFSVDLIAGVEYLFTMYSFSGGFTETVTFNGPGDIVEVIGGPGATYAYTYVAINDATGLVVAQSVTSNFTGLPTGTYTIVGVSYLNSILPSSFINKSLSQILSDEGCLQYSSTEKTVIVQGLVPVELISFSGYIFGKNNVLDWITANELNNKGFDIERSKNALEWQKIGFQEAQALSFDKHEYQFIDDNPLLGISYYRLKQLDLDGKYEYSNIISLYREPINGVAKLKLYPNPTQDHLVVEIQGSKEAVNVTLLNQLGKVVYSQSGIVNQTQLDISHLPSGVYYCNTTIQEEVISKKVVLLRE